MAAGAPMRSSEPPATSTRDNGTAGSSVLGSAHHPGPAVFVRLARISDAVVAVGALIGAFLVTNVGRMPQGFGDFLALRITVTNLLLVLAFALVWRVICSVSGLYRWQLVRRRRDEAVRVLLASLVGGAIALVFAAISVTGAFRVITRSRISLLISIVFFGKLGCEAIGSNPFSFAPVSVIISL